MLHDVVGVKLPLARKGQGVENSPWRLLDVPRTSNELGDPLFSPSDEPSACTRLWVYVLQGTRVQTTMSGQRRSDVTLPTGYLRGPRTHMRTTPWTCPTDDSLEGPCQPLLARHRSGFIWR